MTMHRLDRLDSRPASIDDLSFSSASAAAAAIRRREVSARELVDHVLARIDRLNPRLNAVVTLVAESARARADEADRALDRGQIWGPLHGVPVTIKDTFETAGLRTTAGAPFLAQHVPARDAVAVDRIRRAGAVILGKTNLPLLASDWQSYNDVFGRTDNPWSAAHTPGGSSGGCAAAVAAGLSYLSIGSDIGGSIRVPASFCGLYGHKPTIGVVPLDGHIPPLPGFPAGSFIEELPVAGPLARGAADLRLALEVLGGATAPRDIAWRWSLPQARRTSIRDYRVRFVIDDEYCPVTGEVRALLRTAVEALRSAGAKVEEGWPEGVDPKAQLATYLYLLFQAMDGLQPDDVKAAIRAGKGASPFAALRARALDDRFHDARASVIDHEAVRAIWRKFFTTHDAFLSPVTFGPAHAHDPSAPMEARKIATPEGDRAYNDLLRWIAFATVTGCPATTVPVGVTSAALPVGLQIMGPFLEDATPIHLAGALGDLLGGWKAPPGFA
jgi:amidase